MANDVYDDLATPLGHLVIAFNKLEVALTLALMTILKQDEKAASDFARLGFSHKFDRMTALLIEDDDIHKQLSELLDRAMRANEERNRLVHAEYTAVLGDNQEVLVFLHQKLRDFGKQGKDESLAEIFKHIKPINSEEVGAAANDAGTVANDLLVLSEKFKA